MLEVVFSKSAEGGLKVAQTCGEQIGGAVSVCVLSEDGSKPSLEKLKKAQKKAEEEQKLRQARAVSIGGNHKDVYCFPLCFSVGKIGEDLFSQERMDSMTELFPFAKRDAEYFQQDVRSAGGKFPEFLERAASGEPVRIWYSEYPDEYCGLCWLLSEIRKRKISAKISTIRLPREVYKEDHMELHLGWGDVLPEDFHSFLPLEQEASPYFIMSAAMIWGELREQNGNLRAVINGNLQSVPDDFYDFFILRELNQMEEEFHEARLIGNVLGRCQLGIGDMWVAYRIEEMIRKGKLIPTTTPEPDALCYRRMLRKI